MRSINFYSMVLLFLLVPALGSGEGVRMAQVRAGDSGAEQIVQNEPDSNGETGSRTGNMDRKGNTGEDRNERPVYPEPPANGMITVSLIILVFIVLFFWEPVRLDIIALGIPAVLILLEPWTGISPEEGLKGFSSTATITVLAMLIISEGIRKTGVIQILGESISSMTEGSETRQIGLVAGLSGPIAGFINNTPVVAIFIPMVTRMAKNVKTSPSKLFIPLSYAAMMGGTLTLIGSSTNLLASELSADLLNHPISMFEFSLLGVIVLVFGTAFLVVIGRYLIPERLEPGADRTEAYEMGQYLTEVLVQEHSEVIGLTVGEALEKMELDMDIVQMIRDGKHFMEPLTEKAIRPEDKLILRTDYSTLLELLSREGFKVLPDIPVNQELLEEPVRGQKLLEVVIPGGSMLDGQTLEETNFVERYDSSVLAFRRGEELEHTRIHQTPFQAGDVLLLHATDVTVNRLRNNPNFLITREVDQSEYRQEKMSIAILILASVIALAAFSPISIVPAALSGVVLMVLTGCLNPNEIYRAVNWEVIFLLAGLLPLGQAMQETGTATYIASFMLEQMEFLSPALMLVLFYVLTVVFTNLIHKNATVVLMIPVAVDAAQQLGAQEFSFLLAVLFAASTAFLTPLGNHTNLMVYGPGGYRFRDFFYAGAPLQVLMTIITPASIILLWGI